MYRVIAIVCAGLALAACSSTPDWMKTPDWMSVDALKPQPVLDTVRLESEPPGAEAKTSNGQTCRTPCALALPTGAPLTVTFALNGYQSDSESLEPIDMSPSSTQLRPNPVVVELTPLPPPPKPVKPPVKKKAAPKKKVVVKKPAAPKPAAGTAPAPAPMTATPPPQQAPSPWPGTPAPSR